jgi:hypothetical protein
LARLAPLALELVKHGCDVVLALKDVSRAQTVLPRKRVRCVQAPVFSGTNRGAIEPLMTFAHILHNVGFCDRQVLLNLTDAWKALFELVKPDAIVFDHSPTALLASRGMDVKKVVVGSGFFCPPDQHPLPNLRSWINADLDALLEDEIAVLRSMNSVLAAQDQPPLERVTQMYGEVDEVLLTTFAELDHYGSRRDGRYWGAWTKVEGVAPEWPAGSNKRIFAYLKPFPQISDFLGLFKRLGHRTIVHPDGIGAEIRQRFEGGNIHFEAKPVDLPRVGEQCDLAILNGNHGSTISMLLSGKPSLHLPLTLEQSIFARAVARMGGGVNASSEPDKVVRHVQAALAGQFTPAAEQFARKYEDFDADDKMKEMAGRVIGLVRRR